MTFGRCSIIKMLQCLSPSDFGSTMVTLYVRGTIRSRKTVPEKDYQLWIVFTASPAVIQGFGAVYNSAQGRREAQWECKAAPRPAVDGGPFHASQHRSRPGCPRSSFHDDALCPFSTPSS